MICRSFGLVGLGLMNASCVEHKLAVHEAQAGLQTENDIELSLERELDLLVLVDNSSSMQEEQAILTAQFPKLMLALGQLPGGFPNAHIGVVSSDLGAGQFTPSGCETPGGDGACLQCTAGVAGCTPPDNCRAGGQGGFIDVTNVNGVLDGNFVDVATEVPDTADEDGDGNTTELTCTSQVVSGKEGKDACDIAAAFSCIAKLGTSGCGFEQHLEVVKKALQTQGEGTCNGSFLRDGSLLMILVLADEDDCSAQNTDIFTTNPTQEATFGPLNSYRCFEFGVSCDQAIPRTAATLTGCEALEDCGSDCYLTPPSEYADFLRDLRPEGKLYYAVIGGEWSASESVTVETVNDTSTSGSHTEVIDVCQGPAEARPGIRLRAVADALGDDGIYASDLGDVSEGVCSDNYSPVLGALEVRIRAALTPGCLQSPLINADGDLIETAAQAQCTVQQQTGAKEPVTLPRCQFASTSDDCPPLDQSPGTVTNWDSEVADIGACWHLCDSSSLPQDGGRCGLCSGSTACSWQFRVCRDEQCLPTTLAPDDTSASLRCSTCEPELPGCLCGDGVCDSELDEDASSCSEDCT